MRVLGHRQTKEAATDNPHLRPPRHISTLPRQLRRNRSRSLDQLQYQSAAIPISSHQPKVFPFSIAADTLKKR